MDDFAKQIRSGVENAIVKFFQSDRWFETNWHARISIPQDDIREVYATVDMARVKARVKEKIEERIADSIINNLATELGTDVKKIMCNTELREDLRATLRAAIRGAKDGVSGSD